MAKGMRLKSQKGAGSLDLTTLIIVGVMGLVLLGIYYKMYMRNVSEGFEDASVDVKPNEVVLVLFFADWCPHCRSFKPDWDKVKSIEGTKTASGKNIRLVEVDCTETTAKSSALMEKYEVEGFPSVKVLSGSSVEDYDGARTYKELKSYAKSL